MLAEYLTACGMECLLTREPGGTPLAESIRQVVKSHHGSEPVHPETELLLMEAARAQHVHEVILPALAAGKTVICDRFYDSTTAYQGGARNLPLTTIHALNSFAAAGRKPDLTFLMDLPPEIGFERIRARESEGYDRFENEKIQFHHTVRQAFLDLAAAEPERVKVINADNDINSISNQIRNIVDEHLR